MQGVLLYGRPLPQLQAHHRVMGKLIERLEDAARSGVYRSIRADEIVEAARGSELAVARIAFAGKETLLRDVAQALQFPKWFGGNWDALQDCLGDLSWSQARGHILVVEDAKAGDELDIFIEVLRSSAQYWVSRGRPFFAVFIDPAASLALPGLYRGK
jgi:hypothetical protein